MLLFVNSRSCAYEHIGRELDETFKAEVELDFGTLMRLIVVFVPID